MKVIATTSEQMLDAVLFHLHARGWPIADSDKLVDAYLVFTVRTRRCVYGLSSGPDLRMRLRAALEADLQELARKGRVQLTTSRNHVTPEGLKHASMLKLERALYGTLLDAADAIFPPRTLTAARP